MFPKTIKYAIILGIGIMNISTPAALMGYHANGGNPPKKPTTKKVSTPKKTGAKKSTRTKK